MGTAREGYEQGRGGLEEIIGLLAVEMVMGVSQATLDKMAEIILPGNGDCESTADSSLRVVVPLLIRMVYEYARYGHTEELLAAGILPRMAQLCTQSDNLVARDQEAVTEQAMGEYLLAELIPVSGAYSDFSQAIPRKCIDLANYYASMVYDTAALMAQQSKKPAELSVEAVAAEVRDSLVCDPCNGGEFRDKKPLPPADPGRLNLGL